MADHRVYKCQYGQVHGQCKCPSRDKAIVPVECDVPGLHRQERTLSADQKQTLLRQVLTTMLVSEDSKYPLQAVWDRLLEMGIRVHELLDDVKPLASPPYNQDEFRQMLDWLSPGPADVPTFVQSLLKQPPLPVQVTSVFSDLGDGNRERIAEGDETWRIGVTTHVLNRGDHLFIPRGMTAERVDIAQPPPGTSQNDVEALLTLTFEGTPVFMPGAPLRLRKELAEWMCRIIRLKPASTV